MLRHFLYTQTHQVLIDHGLEYVKVYHAVQNVKKKLN